MYNGEASGSRGLAIHGLQAWRRALPYLGTFLIFTLIFWRIPVARVAVALKQAPALKFVGVFLPYSAIYWLIDSACLTWVVRRFNKPLRFREILPIRASMYLLSLINTNLGQGGVAWYLHRKARLPFVEILSSILFIALMEVYQLFLFSTAGVVLFRAVSHQQAELVHLLRIVYAVAWCVLAAVMAFFAQVRRDNRLRKWIQNSRINSISRSFVAARPLDYATILAIKAPSFALALVAQHFALALYGITIPFLKLVLFLPLVFLAAALPIAIAHLGTSQAAWLLFFSGNAAAARILAYSLVAHFTFMFCNGFLGLLFLPYASRELTALEEESATQPRFAPSAEEFSRQLERMEYRGPAQLHDQFDTLLRARLIHLVTIRKDNTQSTAASLWFTTTSDRKILIQSGPDSWQTKRVRRGSPVIVWFGRRRDSVFIGKAQLISDPTAIEQIIRDYPRKYLMARLGLQRPTRSSFDSGERLAMKITLLQALPRDFKPKAGVPAPELAAEPATFY
jgi:hypothetical protein